MGGCGEKDLNFLRYSIDLYSLLTFCMYVFSIEFHFDLYFCKVREFHRVANLISAYVFTGLENFAAVAREIPE